MFKFRRDSQRGFIGLIFIVVGLGHTAWIGYRDVGVYLGFKSEGEAPSPSATSTIQVSN
jgi:hypothetical protein